MLEEVERRWATRFGEDDLAGLRLAIKEVVTQIDIELPRALPGYSEGESNYPPRRARSSVSLSLPTLLSQLLVAFAIEFDLESRTPLWLCASPLRVLSNKPIRESDVPRLTGASPKTSGIGWQIKP